MGSESFDCREGSGKALDERKDPSVVSQRMLVARRRSDIRRKEEQHGRCLGCPLDGKT